MLTKLVKTTTTTIWSDFRTRLGVTEARAQNIPAIACIDGPLQVRVTFDMIYLDGRVFYTWLACPVVARHAIYEVPLRATLQRLAQAP
jgi:hypothetical protein